jgi:hypothetical protein
MKLNHLFQVSRTFRMLLIAALAILSAGVLRADNFFDDTVAGINLGNASGGNTSGHKSWAIFALSGGVTITDTTYNGTYDVLGNIGMYGSGGLTMSASRVGGFMAGDIYRAKASQTINMSGGANYTGTMYTGVGGSGGSGLLGQAASAAITASSTAATLVSTFGTPSNINLRSAASYYAAANEVVVMNLTDLILNGTAAVLTLNGPSTANYVINISRYLALSNSAQIQLSGGLQPQNVLFNVTSANTNDVTLSGNSTLNGIILAANRAVKLTGASDVVGEVIGKSVSLSGRSTVKNPLVSP